MYEVKEYKDNITLSNKIKRAFWSICYLFLFKCAKGPLFWNWRVLVLRMFGAQIGIGCKIYNNAVISEPWNLKIGDVVCIGPYSKLYTGGGITIGNKVTISQYSYLCTESHDISSLNKPFITKPITIGSFAWICADCFIGMGVEVGEGAVVGARSAVFKNVESWAVVGGNPAIFIKQRKIKD